MPGTIPLANTDQPVGVVDPQKPSRRVSNTRQLLTMTKPLRLLIIELY